MKIDYTKSIKFIVENFDKLDLKKADLLELQKTLTLLKIQVKQQIIQENINGNTNLSQQIESVKDALEKRIITLRKQLESSKEQLDFPEYVPQEKDENIAEGLQANFEVNAKKEYDEKKKNWTQSGKKEAEKKIAELETMISKLEQISTSLDNPQEFIQQIVKLNLGVKEDFQQDEYQRLINMCATNMAYGYMSMETARTEKNCPLFSHDGKSNFTGYSPNPEAISKFLNLIRNPELVSELDSYVRERKKVELEDGELKKKESALHTAQEIEHIFKDLDVVAFDDVEAFIQRISQLTKQKLEQENQIRQSELPTTKRHLLSFVNRIIGKKKEKQVTKLREQYEESQKELSQEISEHFQRLKVNPLYERIFNTYLRAADLSEEGTLEWQWFKDGNGFWNYGNEKDFRSAPRDAFSPITPRIERYEKLRKMAEKGEGMRSFVMEKINPQKEREEAEASVETARTTLDEGKKELAEQYKGLSPKGKELADKRINMDMIKKRYIDVDERDRYGVSPFVASLILETLMNMDGIKTVEDAEKYGISITQDDIDKYHENATHIVEGVSRSLQKVSEKGQDLEER